MANVAPRHHSNFLVRLFDALDRRVIYFLVAASIGIPLIFKVVLPPAKMETASMFFEAVDKIDPKDGRIVLVAADWGPGTLAENKPQTLVAIEHLFRKRIPFALISITPFATPFLDSAPADVIARLQREMPQERWTYGVDWVNLGYRPNVTIMIQGLAKAKDLKKNLQTDGDGTDLSEFPILKRVQTLKDISTLIEITGLQGVFSAWVQFFQIDGYRPVMLHGCTSVSIPDAHIYLASKQISGLFEGMAGAAWYDKLLSDKFPGREVGPTLLENTCLAIAQLLVLGLIILGNIGLLLRKLSS